MTNCVIYARYSSNLQSEKSIEDQVSLCKDAAARAGYTVLRVYADRATSGTSILKRQQFLKMVEDAEEKEFQIVVSEGLDRLSRNQADIAYFYQKMQFHDVGIYSVSDGGLVGEMHVALKGYQNSAFIKDLGQKTRRGQVGTVRGGRMAGSVAYGYRIFRSVEVPTGGREIDPDEAEVVRRIFREYVAGVSPKKIATTLNKEGISGAEGALWRATSLLGSKSRRSGLLRNDLYRGVFKWGKTEAKRNPSTGRRVNRAAPDSALEVIERPDLRIIEDDLWFAARDRLAASSLVRLERRRRPVHLLTGLLECGWCGKPYIVQDRDKCGCSGRTNHGICDNTRRVARSTLEKAVLETVSGPLLHPSLFNKYVREYQSECERLMAETGSQANALSRREVELDRKTQRLVGKVTNGEAEGAGGYLIMAEIHKLAGELDAVRAELKAVPTPLPPVPIDLAERLRTQLKKLASEISGEGANATEARNSVRALIQKVIITPGDIPTKDKRGSGPLDIEIHGPIAALLSLSEERPIHMVSLVAGTTLPVVSPPAFRHCSLVII